MKRGLFLLLNFTLLTSVCISQPQWYEQNSNSNRELTDVCFVDENNGWISGWTGTILHTTDGGQTWNPQDAPPTNAYFSLYFTDAMNGWAVGYNGKIVHTTDGGQTWVDQTAPVTTDYYKVYFVDSQTGWIAGGDEGGFPSYINHRVILHTSNGGATWIDQYSEAYESKLRSIHFVDQNRGFATGESGAIMRTTDGGNNWSEPAVISSYHFYDVFFTDSTTGYIIGEYLGVPHYAAIFKTDNGGFDWTETQLGIDESLAGICFTDANHGWVVGGGSGNGGLVYYTSDMGGTWTMQNIPAVDFLYRVFFVDENSGWASGHIGTIIATENQVPVELTSFTVTVANGNAVLNWQTATETNNEGFEIKRSQKSNFKNQKEWEKVGFIEGHGTTTSENSYTYTDKNLEQGSYSYKLVQVDFDGTRNESEAVDVEITAQPNDYKLMQNYPNPFNPTTTINYSIPEKGNVTLEIYNSLGEKVSTLVDGFKQAGSHQVTFDGADLSSGTYFYRIRAGSFVETRKMLLIK
jgi:photosystem II stability/assembly factor-like uncharacterized protein